MKIPFPPPPMFLYIQLEEEENPESPPPPLRLLFRREKKPLPSPFSLVLLSPSKRRRSLRFSPLLSPWKKGAFPPSPFVWVGNEIRERERELALKRGGGGAFSVAAAVRDSFPSVCIKRSILKQSNFAPPPFSLEVEEEGSNLKREKA